MTGLDTSFLVALTIREHPYHQAAINFFDSEIRNRDASIAITPQVLAEFVHVITDSHRFQYPIHMDEAVEICEQWWHARECVQVFATNEAVNLFLSWMREHRLGRKQILDTQLAACYHCSGISKIATTNWRDFKRYGVFQVVSLEESGS